MTTTKSRFSLAIGLALLGATATLAGCGGSSPTPVSQTTTTERSTTMMQPPPMSSSSTTTTQQVQRP
jgi:ABC-type glycerol-3-phosphate transport system substrate-binding protein